MYVLKCKNRLKKTSFSFCDYFQMPKGDIVTPTLITLLILLTTINNKEKNFNNQNKADSQFHRTISTASHAFANSGQSRMQNVRVSVLVFGDMHPRKAF